MKFFSIGKLGGHGQSSKLLANEFESPRLISILLNRSRIMPSGGNKGSQKRTIGIVPLIIVRITMKKVASVKIKN